MNESKTDMRYLIIYSNGHREVRKTINPIFIHLQECGVVKFIFDCKELKEWQLNGHGFTKVLEVGD